MQKRCDGNQQYTDKLLYSYHLYSLQCLDMDVLTRHDVYSSLLLLPPKQTLTLPMGHMQAQMLTTAGAGVTTSVVQTGC